MDRQKQLLDMARRMSGAVAASNWAELAALNTMMSASLPAMAAQGRWTAAEKAALIALRQQHRLAVQHAAAASTELGRQLAHMKTHKAGWIAYALDNELADNEA
jgi:hypothetical protein